jgi:tetratricopeptide (TPR) repeat protein
LDLFARDYDRAAEDLANMPASAKELPSTFLLEATVARARGDRERALVFFQKARDRILEKLVNRPNDPSLLGDLSWADAGLGRKEDAIREARQAVQLVPISRDAADGVTWTTMLAEVYMETGQGDAALEELAKIVNLPCAPNYGELRFDPVWDKVRTNPKFEELLQQSSQPLVYE